MLELAKTIMNICKIITIIAIGYGIIHMVMIMK